MDDRARFGLPPDDRPPRVAWGMYKRIVLGGLLVMVLTAASVSTAALLKVKHYVDIIRHEGTIVHFTHDTITPAEAGKPQTILLVGSDKRYGAGKGDARSDTLMLLRLDPHQQATAVLSIPRDLRVDIPGHGMAKINSAYSYGGLNLTTETVKDLLGIDINHAIGINFRGFRKAVDYVGCVYVDVDRRYYHSNAGLPPSQQYAEINIQAGYQKLCGQKALDYVRFRHADSDLVRAARQQDFLRNAKEQVGTSRIISELDPLTRVFARATETDGNLASNSGILRLLKLAVFSSGHPIREIHFPASFVQSTDPMLGDYVTASPGAIDDVVNRFMHAKASSGPRHQTDEPVSASARRHARQAKKHSRASKYADLVAAHLVDARRAGEDEVASTVAGGKVGFPLYFPSALTPLGRYATMQPNPRVYSVRGRDGRAYKAYRLVVVENELEGQYYGVQGTTWRRPPILSRSGEPRRMVGRTYRLYYDGSRLRLVAWRTPRGVYWVSNTLSLDLTNKQMLGIARSLTRFGGP